MNTLFFLLSCSGETPSAPEVAAPPKVVLNVEYGSEKKAWMEEMISKFDASGAKLSSGETIFVKGIPAGSGEAVQDILSGKGDVHVFSPASSAYLELLNQEWQSQPGHTSPVCGSGDALVLSPVVIAMWKPMAEALGWPAKAIGWADLLKVSADPRGWSAFGHAEWGAFKLGHTHPGLSNSGLLGVLAEIYAGAGKTRGLDAADLANPAVNNYVANVEGSLVHYGKSTSFFMDKMIERGPSYVSAAVVYENLVVDSYKKPGQFPLVSIYPVEGTFWSDHPYSVLNTPNVGAQEKEAAKLFLDYLKARPAQEVALQYGFRPGDPGVHIAAPVDAAHGADPNQPQTLLEVPGGDVLQQVLRFWENNKKTSDVILVFDKSGSMRGQPLKQAQAGASEFLRALGNRDTVSLQFFDNVVLPSSPAVALGGGGREQLQTQISTSIASGGTALYDAIDAAYGEASRRAAKEPARIHAVVVMTDGRDESSQLKLEQLKPKFMGSEEALVRVFTIAYGSGADPTVLADIASAAGGATAAGDATNIDALFRDMAAFF